jgi:choline-glycine betaine transporter
MAYLSNLNAGIYIFLLLFLLFAGPTINLLELLMGSFGATISVFIPAAFNGDFIGANGAFSNWNTAYYFIWTLVFSPIAGMFYAKIARGRTVRQFILVNWLVPSAFILTWFAMWGGNAVWAEFFKGATIMRQIAEWGVPVANFALLDTMPLSVIVIPITLAAVLIGFITMTDALTGVVSSLTTKNTRAEEAPIPVKFFWGFLIGGLTLVCLFVLNQVGTGALQSMSVSFGIPLLVISIFVIYGSIKVANGTIDKYIDETAEGQADLARVRAEADEE